MIIISSFGITIFGMGLKELVGRPRPDPHIITQIGTYLSLDSFPSGHVLYAMGLYGFLLFLVFSQFKKTILRYILLLLIILILILMGVSRIYLGAHWFSDVLGSYLMGLLWLLLMVYLYKIVVK